MAEDKFFEENGFQGDQIVDKEVEEEVRKENKDKGLSVGAIVGIVIGALLLLVIIIILGAIFYIKITNKPMFDGDQGIFGAETDGW